MANGEAIKPHEIFLDELKRYCGDVGLEYKPNKYGGKSIYGDEQLFDAVVTDEKTGKTLGIMTQSQTCQGTAQDKLVALLYDLYMGGTDMPTLTVIIGEAWKPGLVKAVRNLAPLCHEFTGITYVAGFFSKPNLVFNYETISKMGRRKDASFQENQSFLPTQVQ